MKLISPSLQCGLVVWLALAKKCGGSNNVPVPANASRYQAYLSMLLLSPSLFLLQPCHGHVTSRTTLLEDESLHVGEPTFPNWQLVKLLKQSLWRTRVHEGAQASPEEPLCELYPNYWLAESCAKQMVIYTTKCWGCYAVANGYSHVSSFKIMCRSQFSPCVTWNLLALIISSLCLLYWGNFLLLSLEILFIAPVQHSVSSVFQIFVP